MHSKLLQSDFKMYFHLRTAHQDQGIESFIQKLKKRDRKQSLYWLLEAGVMSKYTRSNAFI
jgi:hypothetical protein